MAAAMLVGCGKEPPPAILEAEGIVLLDGVPLNHAEVRFVPTIKDAVEYTAVGMTDKAGRFKLVCKGEPGAAAGENQVTVMEPEIPAHLKSEKAQTELAKYLNSLGGRPIPRQYGNLASSPLTAKVDAEHKTFKFELSR
jgi:hypothetical protein